MERGPCRRGIKPSKSWRRYSSPTTYGCPVCSLTVLRQLDNRYYRGLNGGYFYSLRFHVYQGGEDEHFMHNGGSYDYSRSVSAEQELNPGKYFVRIRISATRYSEMPSLSKVIKRNLKGNRAKLMQLGSNYDIAHAKGLGFAALRAKHVQRERAIAAVKRKVEERQAKSEPENGKNSVDGKGDRSDEDEDDEADQWSAICVAGLKVYTRDPELTLEVKQHPALLQNSDVKSVRIADR